MEAVDLRKSFGPTPVLRGVSLQLRPGEVLALMGLNGAGKSTLMNILCGAIRPDAGSLRVCGRELVMRGPADAHGAGLAMVHQELQLAPEMTIAENIFLGREPVRRGLIDRRAMNAAARDLLARLGVSRAPSERVGSLSIGERQLVEIAKALATGARVLILDEPTAALSAAEADTLLNLVAGLRAEGAAFIFTSHRLDEVLAVASHILVLRDGRVVRDAPAGEVSRAELIRDMAGREIAEPDARGDRRDLAVPGGEVRLEISDLARRGSGPRPKLEGVALRLHAGEVLGLAGLMGSGRTELLEVVAGVAGRDWSGDMRLRGGRYRPRDPRDAIAAGMAYVTEDRKATGLVLGGSIAGNIALGSLDRLSRLGWVSGGGEAKLAEEMMRRLSVRATGPGQCVGELSGGNQQKVVMAKWLARRPDLLLLDEPTRGVDVGAKSAFYGLLEELSAAGVATLLASSDWPELLALSHRILVLRDGRPTALFGRGEANAEILLDYASAGGPVQPAFESREAA
ncbi:sugar ABC transporter ATP-binding protein [Phenylobacterium sp. VNQ135]|uniref:sugar ABC transporter ATP-binding protein n=1 Tax=Phenylobacterium sp. VNQ135 TaxID=3400922 RepID=UPI003C10FC5A